AILVRRKRNRKRIRTRSRSRIIIRNIRNNTITISSSSSSSISSISNIITVIRHPSSCNVHPGPMVSDLIFIHVYRPVWLICFPITFCPYSFRLPCCSMRRARCRANCALNLILIIVICESYTDIRISCKMIQMFMNSDDAWSSHC
uniref:Uncharacterized protein n=1 Tax=Anopheles maculatus TaxID=74869 RepID=A0A182SS53_9DIPT